MIYNLKNSKKERKILKILDEHIKFSENKVDTEKKFSTIKISLLFLNKNSPKIIGISFFKRERAVIKH